MLNYTNKGGNAPPNGPSQTGRPSGGGRGNNPPRPKSVNIKRLMLVLSAVAFSLPAQAQLYGYGGSYLCTDWQRFGGITQKIKRRCENAQNRFQTYWQVCTPSYSGWQCQKRSYEPSF